MAHKKGGGSSKNGRDSASQRLGLKRSGGNQYHDRGVLSMAHAGKDTGGSQFFICHSRNNTAHLDGVHTCFGKVVDGLDVIDKIKSGDKIEKIVITETK